jgi:hypothetical protein
MGEDPSPNIKPISSINLDPFFGRSHHSLFRCIFYLLQELNTFESWRFVYFIGQFFAPVIQMVSVIYGGRSQGSWVTSHVGAIVRGIDCLITFAPPSRSNEVVLGVFLSLLICIFIIVLSVIGSLIYLSRRKTLLTISKPFLFLSLNYFHQFFSFLAPIM